MKNQRFSFKNLEMSEIFTKFAHFLCAQCDRAITGARVVRNTIVQKEPL